MSQDFGGGQQPQYGQQPYGQQPYGTPPGGFQQQQQPYGTPPGGFQQQGGYPQQAGYPVAPGYAPPMGSGPTEKPGAITGSAVLAFIQAGITLITTGLIFIGLFAAGSDAGAEGWLLAIAQLAGIILLIFGAVQLMSGTNRMLLIVACGLELAVCLYYIIRIAAADTGGMDFAKQAKGAGIVIPLIFAVMPAIALILALGGSVNQYIAARRGR